MALSEAFKTALEKDFPQEEGESLQEHLSILKEIRTVLRCPKLGPSMRFVLTCYDKLVATEYAHMKAAYGLVMLSETEEEDVFRGCGFC